MTYVPQERRKRFTIVLSEAEKKQIAYIMQSEGIPDTAKTIRYCIAEKVRELKTQHETPQKEKAVKHG